MTTQTSRLGLNKHTLADAFRIDDYKDNWLTLDGAPGVLVTSSGALPTWGVGQEGRLVYETDTRLLWYWDGSAFKRVCGKGLVNDPTASQRTTAIATTSTAYVTGVSAIVTVVRGGRPHLVVAEGPGVKNTNGITELSLQRDSTVLQAWRQYGGIGATAAEQPRPVFALALDSAVTPGTYNYYLMFRASTDFAGTSTLTADIDTPLAISIIEL